MGVDKDKDRQHEKKIAGDDATGVDLLESDIAPPCSSIFDLLIARLFQNVASLGFNAIAWVYKSIDAVKSLAGHVSLSLSLSQVLPQTPKFKSQLNSIQSSNSPILHFPIAVTHLRMPCLLSL
jgi:hypothetical protein